MGTVPFITNTDWDFSKLDFKFCVFYFRLILTLEHSLFGVPNESLFCFLELLFLGALLGTSVPCPLGSLRLMEFYSAPQLLSYSFLFSILDPQSYLWNQQKASREKAAANLGGSHHIDFSSGILSLQMLASLGCSAFKQSLIQISSFFSAGRLGWRGWCTSSGSVISVITSYWNTFGSVDVFSFIEN